MGRPAIHGVEGRFPVLAGLAGFLVATDDEDPVVGTGRDRQRGEQADREGGKPDELRCAPISATAPRAAVNSKPTVSSSRITVMIER